MHNVCVCTYIYIYIYIYIFTHAHAQKLIKTRTITCNMYVLTMTNSPTVMAFESTLIPDIHMVSPNPAVTTVCWSAFKTANDCSVRICFACQSLIRTLCVCVYVCMCVCMYVCMYVEERSGRLMTARWGSVLLASLWSEHCVCVCVCMYVCMHVCWRAFKTANDCSVRICFAC